MSADKLSIVPRLPDAVANTAAIQILKDLMRDAEAGEIVGIAVAAYGPDRSVTTMIGGGANLTLLLGGVAYLGHRLSAQIDGK